MPVPKRQTELGPIASLMARITNAAGHRTRRSLDALVHAWRERLPKEIKTDALEQVDPEALNQIARAWNDCQHVKALFHRLIYQNKLAARTYSLEVLNQLVALREYAVVVVHRQHAPSVWDSLYDTRR